MRSKIVSALIISGLLTIILLICITGLIDDITFSSLEFMGVDLLAKGSMFAQFIIAIVIFLLSCFFTIVKFGLGILSEDNLWKIWFASLGFSTVIIFALISLNILFADPLKTKYKTTISGFEMQGGFEGSPDAPTVVIKSPKGVSKRIEFSYRSEDDIKFKKNIELNIRHGALGWEIFEIDTIY